MRVVNAVWEKRNLGVEVLEITLDKDDMEQGDFLFDNIHSVKEEKEYTVLKIPVGYVSAMSRFQKDNFMFLECQYRISKNLDDYVCPHKASLAKAAAAYAEIPKNASDWEQIIEKIGTMFSTDRISLDPAFGKQFAMVRYANWIRDSFEKENYSMYALTAGDKTVGFCLSSYNKDKPGANIVLNGIFEAYQGQGLGPAIIHCPILAAIQRKCGKIETAISSNNPALFRLYPLFGFIVEESYYVLRRRREKF